MIEQVTGQRHHPGHVWRLLRALGWSPQRPMRGRPNATSSHRPLGHARLAADQANAKVEGRWLVFADESGVSLTPPVRTTWAPRGRTVSHPPRAGAAVGSLRHTGLTI
jgi:Winged helix-turn helix